MLAVAAAAPSQPSGAVILTTKPDVTRAINGAANPVTWVFDALGRVTSETNVLGTFAYAYDSVTTRLASVTYPNGQTSTYGYLATSRSGDRRGLTNVVQREPTRLVHGPRIDKRLGRLESEGVGR